jgi:hypothetical protein
LFFEASASAQGLSSLKYSAKVPPSIKTPDTPQTRIGTLKFLDGLAQLPAISRVWWRGGVTLRITAFLLILSWTFETGGDTCKS